MCASPQVLAKVDAVCEDVRPVGSYVLLTFPSQRLAPASFVSATFNKECWVNVFTTTVRLLVFLLSVVTFHQDSAYQAFLQQHFPCVIADNVALGFLGYAYARCAF